MRGTEDLEGAETSVRVTGEEAPGGATEEEVVLVIFGEDFGEQSEPVWGEWGRARVVWDCLKEDEAVLRAKLGSGEDEGAVALCNGVAGALTLSPPPA